MLKVLAIDTATKTGWATNAQGATEHGEEDFSVRRGESRGMRFVRFRAWLENILDLLQPDIVVYEQAHYRGGAATEVCVGLVTRIQEICAKRGIDYTTYHSGTIKKFACGNGRASKDDMIKAAEEKWGENLTENEADALWILEIAKTELNATE